MHSCIFNWFLFLSCDDDCICISKFRISQRCRKMRYKMLTSDCSFFKFHKLFCVKDISTSHFTCTVHKGQLHSEIIWQFLGLRGLLEIQMKQFPNCESLTSPRNPENIQVISEQTALYTYSIFKLWSQISYEPCFCKLLTETLVANNYWVVQQNVSRSANAERIIKAKSHWTNLHHQPTRYHQASPRAIIIWVVDRINKISYTLLHEAVINSTITVMVLTLIDQAQVA